jgi:hypothetical protein
MKHSSKLLVTLGMPLLALSACAAPFSQEVVTTDDFLAVATFDQIQIQSSVVRMASGSTANGGTGSSSSVMSSAASVSSGSDTEDKPAHGAYLYANDNYVIANGDTTFTGYSASYGGVTNYFLINGNKKNGFVTTDSSLLTNYLTRTKTLLATDYAALNAIYENMKTYAGKKASDYPNMSELTLARTVAGDAAGYTLHYVEKDSDKSVETSFYLTMDQIDEKWVFTNYSKRVTTTTAEKTDYSITEYTLVATDALPTLAVSLSDLSIYAYGEGASAVTWPNGNPLTSK